MAAMFAWDEPRPSSAKNQPPEGEAEGGSMRTTMFKALIIAMSLIFIPAHGQGAQLSSTEIEQRNAAAAFATTREAGLVLLMGECRVPLANSSINLDAVARAWFDRNRPELEAARTWLDRYMSSLKATSPAAFQRASTELVRSTSAAVLQAARTYFSRRMPDAMTCERAVKTFATPQLDLKVLALNPGYEQFAEFPQTLARIREAPDFAVPPHLKFGADFAFQQHGGLGNIASLDAAEAARERGDGLGRIAIFKSMAARGDGRAAQQLGLIYLNGQLTDKSVVEAYRWFYAAWSQADAEGLNALGVMTRDGMGVPVDLKLAGASFYLAMSMARSRESLDRAAANASQVEARLAPADKSAIACMTLGALDEALRAPVRELGPLVQGRSFSDPDRRLGSLVKELSELYSAATCR